MRDLCFIMITFDIPFACYAINIIFDGRCTVEDKDGSYCRLVKKTVRVPIGAEHKIKIILSSQKEKREFIVSHLKMVANRILSDISRVKYDALDNISERDVVEKTGENPLEKSGFFSYLIGGGTIHLSGDSATLHALFEGRVHLCYEILD